MNPIATEIQEWARNEIKRIDTAGLFPSRHQLHVDLAARSGLSFSLVQQFQRGDRPNLTVTTLDKLVTAINELNESLQSQ